MQLVNWSEDINFFDLSNEYSIHRADHEEWGLYCSVYYNMRYNGFFREEGFNTPRRNSFWIYKGESRIGGVRMAPNTIYHLFYIPPFNNFINEAEIAWCDFNSFTGGFEAVRRKKSSPEDFIPKEDPNFTNETLVQASTLIYEKNTGQLIANCRLCLQDNQAAVYSIGVMPTYRGRGLATRMLKRALSVLKDKYPVLRLYVMEGNDAESVYLNLGFIPGVLEIQSMYIPLNQ